MEITLYDPTQQKILFKEGISYNRKNNLIHLLQHQELQTDFRIARDQQLERTWDLYPQCTYMHIHDFTKTSYPTHLTRAELYFFCW